MRRDGKTWKDPMRYVRHLCQTYICLGPNLRSDIPISHHSSPSTSIPFEAVHHPSLEASDRPLGQHYSRIPPSLHHPVSSFVILSSFLSHDYDLSRFHDPMTQDSYLGLFLSSRCPTFVPVSPSKGASFLFTSRPLILSTDPLEPFELLVFPHNL